MAQYQYFTVKGKVVLSGGKLLGRSRNATYYYAAEGQSDSITILKNGQSWVWGLNNNGQLGVNSSIDKCSPVSILGNKKTFCNIAMSDIGMLSIDKYGQVWAWGNNAYGQLGINSVTAKSTPTSILGAKKTFCKIASAYRSSAGIDKNGQVWCWGFANGGILGDNTVVSKRTPVSVLGAKKTFCNISTGYYFVSAIDKNGLIWGWGYNDTGQLGVNSTTNYCTPVSILGAKKTFCKITSTYKNTSAIDKNGLVWGWGYNLYGQIGDNSTVSKRTPVSILGAKKTFCKIALGASHTLGIDKNGQIWAWGRNDNGQIGNDSGTNARTPVSILGAKKTFCHVIAGFKTSLGIDQYGYLWAWGNNSRGQFGIGVTEPVSPTSILGTKKTFCKVSAGSRYSLGIDKNGLIWCWGSNDIYELGDGTNVSKRTPVSIIGAKKTFCQISSGERHTIAIDNTGQVWGWGYNINGQIGDNSVTSRSTPVSILGAKKTFCQVSNGLRFTSGIDKNGLSWCWGDNTYGQLGDNSVTSKRTPVSILGTKKTFCQIASGGYSVVTIDKNGQVWAWGYNIYGQLGVLSVVSKSTPVSILGAKKTFCQIGHTFVNSIGIDKNGQVWCWGYNSFGQLGDNSITNRCTPVSILGTKKTFCKVSSGDYFSLGLDKNGLVWGWGYNSVGQLGDNTTVSKRTPVSILGAKKTFCDIYAGSNFSIGVEKNGQVWSWGNNAYGQIGNNINYNTPIRVCNI